MAAEMDKDSNHSDDQDQDTENDNSHEMSPDLLIKHPLQNSWTLWFYKCDRSKSWEDNLREIISFSTVEDFWALYNHIELASRLGAGCDYSLFKEGIKPMWEDERNKKGGRWLINLDKKQRGNCLDTFWLEVVLCLIGESFESESVMVNGAVVNVRSKGDKISMWLCEAKPQDAVVKIGQKLKNRLGIDEKVIIGYEVHSDTMIKHGSTAKIRYQI
eukprot:TRINITY_DN28085_c0_g2_i1.p1 TRINITY_DN28085_c0_g2~~TRINITY_DN28085_c0_g2_i1.p1  ORF type:complete len:230 (-),score=23.06 TRINITY_DN28085_c0_g2_i1:331-978(-)